MKRKSKGPNPYLERYEESLKDKDPEIVYLKFEVSTLATFFSD